MFGHRILEWIGRYGYLGVAVGVLLESAGVPVPGETALETAAFAAASGALRLPLVIVVAAAASILGDNAGYWVGRHLSRGWLERHGRKVLLTPERLRKVDDFFARFGPSAVALARFATGVRLVTPLAAGVARMRWGVFLRFNALGAVAWATLMGGIGYAAGKGWGVLGHPVVRIAVAVFGSVAVMGVFGVLLRRGTGKGEGMEKGQGTGRGEEGTGAGTTEGKGMGEGMGEGKGTGGSPGPRSPAAGPSAGKWWVLVAVGIGTFMSALDASVIATVLPLLARELHASVAGIEWVTTIYLLVVCGLLLGVGRAGDLYGQKRLYLAGFALFVLGSALCGLAGTAGSLVARRAVQAIGAAMLFANSPAILTRAFPATERGRALGAQGTMTYLGLTVGPALGGWIASAFGWRWVFYINVPIGAVAILLSWTVIADDRPAEVRERFDFAGALLFLAGLVALLLALNQGHEWGWGSLPVLAILAGAVGLLAIFVWLERRIESPMLDLALFRSRLFSASTASALLNYICVYSVLFVLPFLLIQGRGLSAQQAGLVLTAQPLVMAVVAPASGALSDRVGSRWLATSGMLVLAVGLVLLALASAGGSLHAIAGALAVVGLGTGAFVSPNNSALMGSAPRHRQGIAAGVLATARNVGMVVGVGVAGAIFTSVLAHGGSAALLHGVQAALYAAAGIAVVGALTSALR
jgi:EmrB/QacA subfamily drug resistance transporter